MSAVHALVSGRVQGVAYRTWCRRQAERQALNGWVRNLSDGRVEALASGDMPALERWLESLWRGPALASVEHVAWSAVAEPPAPDTDGFTIIESAEKPWEGH